MAKRSSRFDVGEVLHLLDSQSLDDFGLIESDESDCEDGDVGSYLPEVQFVDQGLDHSEEEALAASEIGGVPRLGKCL